VTTGQASSPPKAEGNEGKTYFPLFLGKGRFYCLGGEQDEIHR